MTKPMTPQAKTVIERMRRRRKVYNGLGAFREEIVNPDGPEAAAEIERLAGEVARLERNRDMWKGQCERQAEKLTEHTKALAGTWWTIEHQAVAEAMCNAVAGCELGPSDDEGCLTLYDIIPEVWCAPNRSEIHKDLAERLAFAALSAWIEAARRALGGGE